MRLRASRGVVVVLALAIACAGREPRLDSAARLRSTETEEEQRATRTDPPDSTRTESQRTEPQRSVTTVVEAARITVVHEPADEQVARDVEAVLPAAVSRARRWGPLTSATIVVHASEASFRAAVGDTTRRALRAWTVEDVVHLRSPRAWGALGASRGELAEIVAHELVHCATWQRIADRDAWAHRPLPFWFREGMAMELDPALDRAIEARLRRFEALWRPPPGESALAHAESLLPDHDDLAYGLARVGFRELVARGGEAVVVRILDRVHGGATFPGAFAAETGSTVDAFDAAVRRTILAPR